MCIRDRHRRPLRGEGPVYWRGQRLRSTIAHGRAAQDLPRPTSKHLRKYLHIPRKACSVAVYLGLPRIALSPTDWVPQPYLLGTWSAAISAWCWAFLASSTYSPPHPISVPLIACRYALSQYRTYPTAYALPVPLKQYHTLSVPLKHTLWQYRPAQRCIRYGSKEHVT
eukprot:2619005-Rhodomonas_salina.1